MTSRRTLVRSGRCKLSTLVLSKLCRAVSVTMIFKGLYVNMLDAYNIDFPNLSIYVIDIVSEFHGAK